MRFGRRRREERPEKVYVVFSYGDPMPITACVTVDLADEYAARLAALPPGHPLRTLDAQVDELPLNYELPPGLADVERPFDWFAEPEIS